MNWHQVALRAAGVLAFTIIEAWWFLRASDQADKE